MEPDESRVKVAYYSPLPPSRSGIADYSSLLLPALREAGYAGPVWRIPHPAWPDAGAEAAQLDAAPLVGCFGYLNVNKRVPQVLEAFALLRARRPGARLLLVGATGERFDLARRLERLGLDGEAIVREDYVPEERLWSLMAACDVLVN